MHFQPASEFVRLPTWFARPGVQMKNHGACSSGFDDERDEEVRWTTDNHGHVHVAEGTCELHLH